MRVAGIGGLKILLAVSTFGRRRASQRSREVSDPGNDPRDPWSTQEYGELFEAHHRSAYRLALLLCGGEAALAEDLVSDAFIAVYPRWKSGAVADFGPYLRQAVANQVKGTFRRRAVERREQQAQAGVLRVSTSFEDPLTDRQALWDALGELPPKQRVAVALHYYEDRPLEEVASIMGTSVGTAKSHVSRGRDRLRELLGASA